MIDPETEEKSEPAMHANFEKALSEYKLRQVQCSIKFMKKRFKIVLRQCEHLWCQCGKIIFFQEEALMFYTHNGFHSCCVIRETSGTEG